MTMLTKQDVLDGIGALGGVAHNNALAAELKKVHGASVDEVADAITEAVRNGNVVLSSLGSLRVAP